MKTSIDLRNTRAYGNVRWQAVVPEHAIYGLTEAVAVVEGQMLILRLGPEAHPIIQLTALLSFDVAWSEQPHDAALEE